MDVTAATLAYALGRPGVLLLGANDHADFADVVAALHTTAVVAAAASVDEALRQLSQDAVGPELVVLLQDRPGVVRGTDVERLRRAAPLAGVVAVAGSWCEGELRTGRPLEGVRRLYWHEFTAWWRRQLGRRTARLAPDWARPATSHGADPLVDDGGTSSMPHGLVVLRSVCWDTADALADVLDGAGLATVWQPSPRRGVGVWGAVGGIWEGGQLDRREQHDLGDFCRWLGGGVPVVALLDFPRHDSVRQARQAGAHVVLGKPWQNVDLLVALAGAERRDIAPLPSVAARAA